MINQRINYIDALRGFTMFLVVFGHVMLKSFDLGGYNSVIGSIFLIFRMPLFFFIAGFLSYKAHQKWNIEFYIKNINSKFLAQIIPTIFFVSIFLLCKDQNPIIIIPQYGFDGYWFTIVLFEMFIIYFTFGLISKYIHNNLEDFLLIFCAIIGLIVLVLFRGDGGLWDILCLENTTKYFHFFAFGILAKKYQSNFVDIINNHIIRGAITISFIICLLLYFNNDFEQSYPFAYKSIHDIIIRYLGLLVVFISFFHYQDIFNTDSKFNKSLLFIGKRTLDIYLLHYFFIPNLQFLKPYLEPTDMMLIQVVIASIISIIIIYICLLISNIIRTSNLLGHYLFGSKINSIQK